MNKRLHRNNEKRQLDVIEDDLFAINIEEISGTLISIGKTTREEQYPYHKPDINTQLFGDSAEGCVRNIHRLMAERFRNERKLHEVIFKTTVSEPNEMCKIKSNKWHSTFDDTRRALSRRINNSIYSIKFSYVKNIRPNLIKKYGGKQLYYDTKMIGDVLWNANTHFVTTFKDYLIYDDINEFMQRLYLKWEAKNRLSRILEFYTKHSKVFPNYAILKARNYMFENIMRKARVMDNKEKQAMVKKTYKATKNEHRKVFTAVFMKEINKVDSIFDSTIRFTEDSNTQLQSYIKSRTKDHINRKAKDISFKELIDKFIQKDSRSLIDINAVWKDFDISNTFKKELKAMPKKRKSVTRTQSKHVLDKQATGRGNKGHKKAVKSKAATKSQQNTSREDNKKPNSQSKKSRETSSSLRKSLDPYKTVSHTSVRSDKNSIQNIKQFTNTIKNKVTVRSSLKSAKSEKCIKVKNSETESKGLLSEVDMKKTYIEHKENIKRVVSSKTLIESYVTARRHEAIANKIKQINDGVAGDIKLPKTFPLSSRPKSTLEMGGIITRTYGCEQKKTLRTETVAVHEEKNNKQVVEEANKKTKKFRSEYLNTLSLRTKPKVIPHEPIKNPGPPKPEFTIRVKQKSVLEYALSVREAVEKENKIKTNKEIPLNQFGPHNTRGSASKPFEKPTKTYH